MTKLRHGLSWAVVCLAAGAPAAAWGQELITHDETAKPPTVDDYAVLSLEELLAVEVSTSSVKRHTFEDAPATVYVVPASVIRRRGYTHLRALLEDIPEFEMPVKNSAEHSSLITVRGVTGNEKVIILLDGVRISSNTGAPHNIGENYSLANVKQVEIVLGPSSALYGADAFSAVVNLVTFKGGEVNGAKLSGSYGQFNTTDNSFVAGDEKDGVSIAVTGSYFHSDEPNLPDAYRDKYAWYHEQYVPNGLVRASPFAPPFVTVDVGTQPYKVPTQAHFLNVRLDAGDFQLNATRHGIRYSSSWGTLPEYILYVEDAKWEYAIEAISGTHNKKLLKDKLELQTTLGFSSYEVDPDTAFINNFSGYQPGYKYHKDLSGQFEERVTYHAMDELSVSGGIVYESFSSLPKTSDLTKPYDRDKSADTQGLIYPGTDVIDAEGRDLSVPVDVPEIKYQNVGAYAEVFARPHKVVALTAGGRYDYNSRYGYSINPRAGLVVGPFANTRLKLLYGEAYRSPSTYYAFQSFGTFFPDVDPASGDVIGLRSAFWHLPNPGLDPEKLRMVEASVSHRQGDFQAAANGYYTRIRDLIVTTVGPGETFKGWPVDAVERFVNRGSATIYGGTANLQYSWTGGDFAVNPYAAYTYTDGEIEDQELPWTAHHTLKTGLDLGWRNVYLSNRVIARSLSTHPSLLNSEGERRSTDPSAVLNTHLLWGDFVDTKVFALSAYIDVRNVLDARYSYVAADVINAFPDGAPQDPRRVVVGVTAEVRP
jgi:outer membrane receptor protein involved in Fe transport